MSISARMASPIGYAIIVLLCAMLAAFAGPVKRSEGVSKTSMLSDTCPPDAEKKECGAILDALRKQLQLAGADMVFETQYLRIERGWAWIRVTPRSGDGLHMHEDHSALMQKTKGRWSVAELRPGECAWDPGCWDDERYFKKLHARFPAAPLSIFPLKNRK